MSDYMKKKLTFSLFCLVLLGLCLYWLSGCAMTDSSRNLEVNIEVEQGASLTLGDISPDVIKEGNVESPNADQKTDAREALGLGE